MNSYSKANQTFKPFPGLGTLGEMAGEYIAEQFGLPKGGKAVCRAIGHYAFQVAGSIVLGVVAERVATTSTGRSQGL